MTRRGPKASVPLGQGRDELLPAQREVGNWDQKHDRWGLVALGGESALRQ